MFSLLKIPYLFIKKYFKTRNHYLNEIKSLKDELSLKKEIIINNNLDLNNNSDRKTYFILLAILHESNDLNKLVVHKDEIRTILRIPYKLMESMDHLKNYTVTRQNDIATAANVITITNFEKNRFKLSIND